MTTLCFSWCMKTCPAQELSYTWSLSYWADNLMTAAAINVLWVTRMSCYCCYVSTWQLTLYSWESREIGFLGHWGKMQWKWGSLLGLEQRAARDICLMVQHYSIAHLMKTCLCLPQRDQPASPDIYRQAAEVPNASLCPQDFSSLGLKGKSEGLDDHGSYEILSCYSLDIYPRKSNWTEQ